MPKSLPYHDFLISHLKDPSYAACYLETHMELEEGEELDPRLLKLALSHVSEALSEQKMSSEKAKLHQEQLDEILSQQGSEAIYHLGTWLNALGLKLTVTVAEKIDSCVTDNVPSSELPV
ncbi:transcriptional regulator [Nostoc sp. MBR 210]|uniref:Transcriptional regulator n=1 Tax=Nostoc spongiaeforme FACHB-130 TaxID=1357510 RepID=A0ABR8G5Q0_9NOSO|nr:transcriptional regulator [Nostoc spongiaeforme]MBD2598507.1 transcriptional regulator [Nostoc spongiaeforme FACHB-130]OCQ97139.1 transcriptional regulator [Nostoc sp. MBR 210]